MEAASQSSRTTADSWLQREHKGAAGGCTSAPHRYATAFGGQPDGQAVFTATGKANGEVAALQHNTPPKLQ